MRAAAVLCLLPCLLSSAACLQSSSGGDRACASPFFEPCPEPDAEGPARTPSGSAALRLTVTLGGGANPFSASSPWALETLPGHRAEVGDRWGDARSPLVLMLCAQDDPRCEAPLWLRALTDAERGLDERGRPLPVQGRFGPQIDLRDLPEGRFHLMVLLDSLTSRALGYGWEQGFQTDERAWGGVASEGDLMLSDQAPASGFNPPPAPLLIELRADAVTDLGALSLGHFHERDLSPPPPRDPGALVVADQRGLRVLDLASLRLRDNPDSPSLPHFPIGEGPGELCGLINGPGALVYALRRGVEGGAGEAIPFDVDAGRVVGQGRVTFPGQGAPCRGIYHERDGQGWLFVTNAPSERGPGQAAQEGLWGAPLGALPDQDVVASWQTRAQDPLFALGVDDLAAHDDALYLSISPEPADAGRAPAQTLGRHSVFVARFDEQGRVSLARGEDGAPVAVGALEIGATPPAEDGSPTTHPGVPSGWGGLAVGRSHDGRALLFVGGFVQIAVLELPSLAPLPTISGRWYGANFTGFAPSPDGALLWAIPQDKASAHLYFDLGEGRRQTFNRLMALPLDLSQGATVAPSPRFEGENIDDWQGVTDIGDAVTPGRDPGVDLGYGYYFGYQVRWAPSTAGATFGGAAAPVSHTAVATQGALWLRGGGSGEASGLGKGGDLAAFDLETRRAVLFPEAGDSFYPFWSGGVYETPTFGLDLAPERDGALVTRGLVYKP